MAALAENPVAIAEGADGAPRVSPEAQGVTAITDTAIGTVTLSGFGIYGGTMLNIHAANAPGTADGSVVITISTDGTTFTSGFTVVGDIAADQGGSAVVFIDFATGDIRSSGGGQSSATVIDDTFTGFSGPITHVRAAGVGGTLTIAMLATVNAGTVV